jgi:hypothetical protein
VAEEMRVEELIDAPGTGVRAVGREHMTQWVRSTARLRHRAERSKGRRDGGRAHWEDRRRRNLVLYAAAHHRRRIDILARQRCPYVRDSPQYSGVNRCALSPGQRRGRRCPERKRCVRRRTGRRRQCPPSMSTRRAFGSAARSADALTVRG